MRAWLTPLRIGGGILLLLLVTLVILYRIPSGDYLFTPIPAYPAAPLVNVQGAHTPKGSGRIYFVAVHEQQASELDVLFPWLHAHASRVPAGRVNAPCASSQAINDQGLRQMSYSQLVAEAVALRRLGYHVTERPNGVLVDQPFYGTHAICKIQPTDVITAANGRPTPTIAALHAAVARLSPGQVIDLKIRRGSQSIVERVKTVSALTDPKQALIGVSVEPSAVIKLPLRVRINTGAIEGPSAGLAFTLEIMEQLDANVTHGYRIAATGVIHLDGTVSAIGGVEQKTWGSREAGAQVFLVPVDQGNAKLAKQFAGPNLTIIPVTSLGQALHALATLPKLK